MPIRPRRRSGPYRLEEVRELESRIAPALAQLPTNIDGNLAALYRQVQTPLLDLFAGESTPGIDWQHLLRFDNTGQPLAQVWTVAGIEPVAQQLRGLGIDVIGSSGAYRVLDIRLDLADLPTIATLDGVLAVTPIYRPLTNAGSVQTQGDDVMDSDLVRMAGHDGTGIRVGVLSDSALDLVDSQATGDLPVLIDRYLEFAATDEGRAMLEIIHDIAPGASLAHHSAILSDVSFADGIRKLAAAGSRVIVDDVYYFSEPFFQDGIIAQAVNEVTAQGVTYIAAAGNYADRAYEATFNASGTFHDFDSGAGTDIRQQITVPVGSSVTLVFQWDDPFYTTSGVINDFNIRVWQGTTLVASGLTSNLSTQQPLEILSWTGSGTGLYEVEIERITGSGPSVLKYLLTRSTATIDEYATNSSTIIGHAAAAGAIAVGAVRWYSPDTIEPFSSRGDVTIYFDPQGNRLETPVVRNKPDVVAPDGVNTTFFGTDIPEDADTYPNFFGTSAAAPHVAAVAALLLDANPHLTRQELYTVLTSTADDLGPVGYDSTYGFGRVNAEAARLAALAVMDVTPPTAELVSPIDPHGWDVNHIVLRLSEPLAAATATNPANYTLIGAGLDTIFGTGDDVAFTVDPVQDADARTITLTFTAPTTLLNDDRYRLTLDGTGGLTDVAGNPLNSGSDQVIDFTIAAKSAAVTFEGDALLGNPRLALRPDGTVVVVYPNNPSLGGLKWPQVMIGQFDAGGMSQGPLLAAPTNFEDSFRVSYPEVAVNDSGGVVVYHDLLEIIGGEPNVYALRFQMLDALGRPVGTPQLVASVDAHQGTWKPRVVMSGSGAFAIAYQHLVLEGGDYILRVFGRLYDAAGMPLGPAFSIADGHTPSVAVAPDGSFLFVYEHESGGLYARRYDSAGNPLGGEFQIHSAGLDPEIDVAGDGSFVVTWRETQGNYFRRFDSTGQPLSDRTIIYPTGTSRVSVAADGRFVVAWSIAGGPGVFAQRYAADGTAVGSMIWVTETANSQSVSGVEIRDTGEFVVGWTETDGTGGLRWYSWDAPDEALPLGPWVRSLTPTAPVDGSISSITVTFDRIIDTATFTLDDVTLTDPVGRTIAVQSIDTMDNHTFTLTFTAQNVPGRYTVRIGPDVRDLFNTPMNQNGDSANGHGSLDVFTGYFWRDISAVATIPLLEGFESGSIDSLPGFWSFASKAGSIAVVATNGPYNGTYHLRMTNWNQFGSSYREAVLLLDLSAHAGATNLSLDFRLQADTDDNGAYLLVSGDGFTWTSVGGKLPPSPAISHYAHFGYDLDEILAAAGIALDADVYIKFLHDAFDANDTASFDDIRISTLDVLGPRITGMTPTGQVPGPLAALTVTFDEDIDAASFTATDITITGPAGNIVMLSGDPVDSGDRRTFTLNLATPQTLIGTYTVKIGPQVQDLAGNELNQNQDMVNGGGTTDVFTSTFQVGPPTPQVLPYLEDFEVGDLNALTGWSFAVVGTGAMSLVSTDSPYAGGYHLMFDNQVSASTTRESVLLLDLAAQVGATDLVLDFWYKRPDTISSAQVLLSGDGVSWSVLGSMFPSAGQYTHFVYDLDQALASAGIVLDSDVHIKFLHASQFARDAFLDNIRIRQGTLNNAPTLTTVSTFAGGTEDEPYTITYADLAAAANEADSNGDPMSFRVDAIIDGTLTKGGIPVTPGSTLLGPGESLVWIPPLDINGSGINAFTIRAWDGELASGAAIQVKVNLAAVNDAPVLDTSASPMLSSINEDNTNPGGAQVSSFATAHITDPDAGAVKGIAIVGLTGTADGTWQYRISSSWLALGPISEDMALLLRSGDAVRFIPNANFNGMVTINYRAWDQTSGTFGTSADTTTNGGSSAFSTAIETATLTVNPVNDAPVLDFSGDMVLEPIAEDDTSNIGTRVTDIIASAGGDRITDIDNAALEGIAVTAVTNSNGTWQWSIDGGQNWSDFSGVSSSSARLLAADDQTRVRFVPGANYFGTATGAISFRAWDQSSGMNGGTASASIGGGTTPFSTATETATVTVNPVADTPGVTSASTLEDVQTNAGLVISRNPADGAEVTHFKITGISGGSLFLNDGSTPISNGDFLTFAQASAGLKFTPTADSNTPGSFLVQASTSASDAGLGDGPATATVTITPVNDRPSFSGSNPSVLNEDAGPQTVSNWATFSAGPPNESGQTVLGYTVSNVSNASLFAVLPSVAVNGTLTFTAAANAFGSSTFDVVVQDNGGMLNGGVDTSLTQTFTITVNPVNDRPSFAASNPATVQEDAGAQTLAGWATFNPGAANEAGQTASYTISNVSNSALFAVLPTLSASGTLTYTPAAQAFGSSTFDVTVQDSGGIRNGGVDTSLTHIFTITVDPVNDAPVLDSTGNPTLTTIPRNTIAPEGNLVAELLAGVVSDNDPGALSGIAIVSTTGSGTWQLSTNNGLTWSSLGTASVSSARLLRPEDFLQFLPLTGFAGSATIEYHAWDQTDSNLNLSGPGATGGSTAFSSAVETAHLRVAMTLRTIKEDARKPRGNKVGALLSPEFKDVNPTWKGIAVAGVTGNGTWQFSLNRGRKWKPFPLVSESSALLLRGRDQVRFIPAANWNGTASISYHAWDRTVGSHGGTGNVSGPGFGALADLSLLTVKPVNDRPVLDNSGSPTLQPGSNTVADLLAATVSDVDGLPAGIAIIAASGRKNGTWQLSLNGGQTWTNLPGVSATKALLLRPTDLIQFVPHPGFTGTISLKYRAWDQTRGTAGLRLDSTIGTAFSKATELATLDIP